MIADRPVQHWSGQIPDAPFILGPEGPISYGEAERRIGEIGQLLRRSHIPAGMPVGIVPSTTTETILWILACLGQKVPVCLPNLRRDPRWRTDFLREAGASLLIVDHDTDSGTPTVEVVQNGTRRTASARQTKAVQMGPVDVIVSTSGTRGRARAVGLTNENLYFNALGSNENIALGPGDVWMLNLPLYHVGGLGVVYRAMIAGAAIALPDHRSHTERPTPDVTHLSLVPTQLRRLLDGRLTIRSPAVKAVLLGGAAADHRLIARAVEAGIPLCLTYGLTEMGSQVCTTAPGEVERGDRSSGRPLPYRELRISEAGEIQVRGRTRFEGYLQGSKLHRPFDSAGWFETGDLGYVDDGGRLHVKGRRDNMFVSGGENIHPEEIEAALLSLEGVEEAVVVPVSDPEFGQRPFAFVRIDTRDLEPGVLSRALRDLIPGFMIPVDVRALPVAGAGLKHDRRELELLASRMHQGA